MEQIVGPAGNNPCFGCSDRKIGCHGICEKYLSWKKQHEETMKKIRKYKGTYYY